MSQPANLALILGRRTKRLKYWQNAFSSSALSSEAVGELKDLFNTFALLLSKLSKAETDEECRETEGRINEIERKLTTRFESYRLVTNDNSIAAIAD